MESEIYKKLEILKQEELKEIKTIKEIFSLQRGQLRRQCPHKYDDGSNALEMAGHPWHTGWDKCLICGTFIETNEYGRGKYLKVVYESDMGRFDGLTRGKTYIVIDQTETQYVVKNDLDDNSTIQKGKFTVLS